MDSKELEILDMKFCEEYMRWKYESKRTLEDEQKKIKELLEKYNLPRVPICSHI